ncbi:MAG: family 1 glycosylhydrolase [Thermotogae bacterium]|nr:family 1 glycosylhydrolase [Thermotogota bacterium]
MLLGAATSAHQIEGGTYNDWSLWEEEGKAPPVGEACNSWERMEEDIALLRRIGANAYRFSLEWSRIEVEEGLFNLKNLFRYRRFVRALLDAGITPIITLHHFTNPVWFYRSGGWLRPDAPDIFARYADLVSKYLPEVKLWITINEPNVYAYRGFVAGDWPPGERSLWKALKVLRHMMRAHSAAYEAIKGNVRGAAVGMAHHLRVFTPVGLLGRIPAALREYMFNFVPVFSEVSGEIPPPVAMMERIRAGGDFIGINYYTRDRVKFSLRQPFGVDVAPEGVWRNSLGWEVYPEGLYTLLKRYSYERPVIITENGMATERHDERVRFVLEHMRQLKRAREEGIDVRGYLYWSLMDNYEWLEGYSAKFGIFTRDRRPKGEFHLPDMWDRA